MIDRAGSGLWRMFECDSHCHERLAILSTNYNQSGADLGGPEPAINPGMAAGAKPGGGRMPIVNHCRNTLPAAPSSLATVRRVPR